MSHKFSTLASPLKRRPLTLSNAFALGLLVLGCTSSNHQDTTSRETRALTLNSAGSRICSALLVSSQTALTAAHCVRNEKELTLQSNSPVLNTRVAVLRKHPFLDVALLELLTPLLRALPVSTGVLKRGDSVKVLVADPSPRFVEGQVTDYGSVITVNYGGNTGPCRGDSGSPLFAVDPDGGLSAVGVLQSGAGHCRGPDRYIALSSLGNWLETGHTSEPISPEPKKPPTNQRRGLYPFVSHPLQPMASPKTAGIK